MVKHSLTGRRVNERGPEGSSRISMSTFANRSPAAAAGGSLVSGRSGGICPAARWWCAVAASRRPTTGVPPAYVTWFSSAGVAGDCSCRLILVG